MLPGAIIRDLIMAPDNTDCMTLSSKRIRPLHSDLFYNGKNISEVPKHTHLGITLSSNP